MYPISIIGVGPGNPAYVLPAAFQAVDEAVVLVGTERHLSIFSIQGKETRPLTGDLNAVKAFCQERAQAVKVGVLASGDPGFYGIAGYLRAHFRSEDLVIIPGISPLQYFFAKLGIAWNKAYLTSVHEGEVDVPSLVASHALVGFLTAPKRSFPYIAARLVEAGLADAKLHVGLNVSYDDEKIFSGSARSIAGMEETNALCVVVVEYAR